MKHGCNSKAVCLNTEGTYKCQCKDGYKGNGQSCQSKPIIAKLISLNGK